MTLEEQKCIQLVITTLSFDCIFLMLKRKISVRCMMTTIMTLIADDLRSPILLRCLEQYHFVTLRAFFVLNNGLPTLSAGWWWHEKTWVLLLLDWSALLETDCFVFHLPVFLALLLSLQTVLVHLTSRSTYSPGDDHHSYIQVFPGQKMTPNWIDSRLKTEF